MNGPENVPPAPVKRPAPWLRAIMLGGPLALVAVLGVLYAMDGFGKASPAVCQGTAATAARLDPLVHGEVAALGLARNGRLTPALSFQGPDGRPATLADFRGRTVLLNLWATWCVPCRKEMPALDHLQAKLGGTDFAVVAVNIDTTRLDQPKAFLQQIGVNALPLYADPTANVFQVLRGDGQALGLPTTVLIDRNGCEIGTMAGPAAWDSEDAQKLIEAAKETSPAS